MKSNLETGNIQQYLDEIPIVDTHEHFLPPAFLADGENTLLRILKNSYMGIDCISAGMDRAWWAQGSIVHGVIDLARHPTTGDVEMDQLFPYLERVRNTAYTRALLTGLRTLYDFYEDLNTDTWKELATRVQRAYETPGWFDTALDRIGIYRAVLDPYFVISNPPQWSNRLLLDFHVDDFLDYPWNHPVEGAPAAQIAEVWGSECNTLNDLLGAIDKGFLRYQESGGIATKIAVAYRRSLLFDPATQEQAAQAFQKLKSEKDQKTVIILGNFIVRHIIRRSIETGFVVQIHTGYQCGHLSQGNPTHLVNLFLEFPQAKFVLFHGGYPYADEAGSLAKAFPNVYLDLCWMPLLSPHMTSDMLIRWIDLVPQNKLMWGGDVWSVEECCGAVALFKETLARALGKLIEERVFSKEVALKLACRIMHQNATELFGLVSVKNASGDRR